MEETEIKDILLELVEPNRNRATDIIPGDVKGWRFPSGDISANDQQPVCFWTGVNCDPIDGSIIGLNLGKGFYVEKLLGLSHAGGKRHHARVLEHGHEKIILRKKRYPESPSNTTKTRRMDAGSSPSFPSSIGRLLSLRFINLSSNQLQGPIPKSVLQLPNLEIFDVSSNDLVGGFPHFASDALRVLDISKNRFNGPLDEDLFGHPDIGPKTAPYLISLVKFDISHNGFNGTIPLDGTSGYYNPDIEHEESFQNLQYFDLGYNLFSGTICNNFGNFENLQGLFLEHNRLVGTIPKSIFRGSGIGAHPLPLVQLFLEQNSLSGTLNKGLATLPNLRELYVDGNKLTGDVPQELCNSELNNMFLNNTQAARGCDGISCPANSASREGVAPCKPCPDDGGFHRYMGQHDNVCRGVMGEVEILDLFFKQTHGNDWLDSAFFWEKGSPACQRTGVQCDDAGQVTNITLQSLGLRGPLIPELGFLSKLEVLDLRNNQLTGFLPSDLRFAPLKSLDIRGSRMQGVVPPLLCIKEGVNGNGIGPPGIDFNQLYACENIVCPRGTYSPIGRASLPENEGEGSIQCLPCYDGQAKFYIGRDQCTDISIAGLKIRRDDIRGGLIRTLPMILATVLMASLFCMRLKRKSNTNNTSSDNDNTGLRRNSNRNHNGSGISLPLQRWVSTGTEGDEYSDDDWTAAYSEGEDGRPKDEMVELARVKSGLPGII